jgi:hypothetical protein
MDKNRKEGQKKRIATLADTHSVHLLRELHRSVHHNRIQWGIRLSEAFDRKFESNTCTRSEQLFREYPMLAFMLIYAFFAQYSKRIRKKRPDRRAALGECFILLFEYLMKYETTTVSDVVVAIIDDTDTHRKPKRIVKLVRNASFPQDQIINSDSVLTHRAANVCVSYAWFGRCDFENDPSTTTPRKCGGRHLCLEPACRTRRAHSTPMCTHNSLAMTKQTRDRVRKNIGYAKRGKNRQGGGGGGNSAAEKKIKKLESQLAKERKKNKGK